MTLPSREVSAWERQFIAAFAGLFTIDLVRHSPDLRVEWRSREGGTLVAFVRQSRGAYIECSWTMRELLKHENIGRFAQEEAERVLGTVHAS